MKREVAKALAALASGIVFGAGLALSRMTDPNKILAFLNLAGSWDPSLLFVMGGALTVAAIGYRVAIGTEPVFDLQFHLPAVVHVDRRLITGAAIFGIGWGLGGFCPGPAVVALGSGAGNVLAFVVALIAGGWATNRAVSKTY